MAGVCTAPQPDEGLVQGLLGSVDCNVRAMAEAGYGAVAQPNSPLAPALTAMLTLYIAFIGYRLLVGRAPLQIGELTITVLKFGAVLALATNWPTYRDLVFETLFRGPEQLAASLMAVVQPSDSALPGNPFDGLQVAYDELQRSALFFSQHSLGTASPLQGGNAGAALALNASALLMLLTSLGAVLAAKIVLGLLLGLGPVFVAFLLFDATRGIFEGWLRASIAFALAPLMAVLGLVVQLTLIEPQLLLLADQRSQGLVDVAPANAIFLLTLISTLVSVALAIAVGLVANGLRLRWTPVAAASSPQAVFVASSSAVALEARGVDQLRLEPRAAAVAAAAAAMDRREARLAAPDGPGPRRIAAGSARRDATGIGASITPIAQAYRRSAGPRTMSSNLRRDS